MVLVGFTIVVVWPILIDVGAVDDVVEELPPLDTSTTITTISATTNATAPAIAQPRPRDRWSFMQCP
jgi:hypothetical protein